MHNPQSDGYKRDENNGIQRMMSWTVDRGQGLESPKIEYKVGDDLFNYTRTLQIYTIEQLHEIVLGTGLEIISLYENYTQSPATNASKNIQIILSLS